MKQADVSKQLSASVRSVRNMAALSPHRQIPPKLSWSLQKTALSRVAKTSWRKLP